MNAINIIIGGFALQYSASTKAISVKQTNDQFLTICIQHIFPELDAKDVNELPYMKSTAIKFIFVFRNQIPPQFYCNIVCKLPNFMLANNLVVSNYASIAIEKLLFLKDHSNNSL